MAIRRVLPRSCSSWGIGSRPPSLSYQTNNESACWVISQRSARPFHRRMWRTSWLERIQRETASGKGLPPLFEKLTDHDLLTSWLALRPLATKEREGSLRSIALSPPPRLLRSYWRW